MLILAACLLASTLLAPAAKSEPSEPYTHPSGILILPEGPNKALGDLNESYAIADRLSSENPSDFGYPTVRDNLVVLSATSPLARPLVDVRDESRLRVELNRYEEARRVVDHDYEPGEALAASDDSVVKALLTSVVMSSGDVSRKQTEALQNEVFDLAVHGYEEANAFAAEVDAANGKIVLYMEELTPDLADALVAKFDASAIEVVLEKRLNDAPFTGGRRDDMNPFYGGAEITGLHGSPTGYYHSCSTAFAWESSGTFPMLSAGHCAPWGDSNVQTTVDTDMGNIESASRENWTYDTGTVHLTGQTGYYGDISLIRMSDTNQSWARMYRGGAFGTSYNTVKSVWPRRTLIGDQFCTGGKSSGENCDWKVHNVGMLYQYGEIVRYAVASDNKYSGNCTFAGDSGGSVFTVRSDGYIAAKGVISGGLDGNSEHKGTTFFPCRVVYSDIFDPIQAFPGSVKLG